MTAHIPVGHLALNEAFARFYRVKWGGNDPIAELSDSRFTDHFTSDADASRHHIAREKVIGIDRRRFLEAFLLDELEALYLTSDFGGMYRIPPSFWSDSFFPERLFLLGGQEVAPNVDSDWGHLVGHTPFANRDILDRWIVSYMSAQLQDPKPAKPRRLLAGILLDLIDDHILTGDDANKLAKDWLLPHLGNCVPLRQFSWAELEAEPDFPPPQTTNRIVEGDPAQLPQRKSGRPRGSTQWPEKESFIVEMVRRLGELGEPSRSKTGWESWETARSIVMEWFTNTLPEPTEPSTSTAKSWVKEARERWEKSKKSENSVA